MYKHAHHRRRLPTRASSSVFKLRGGHSAQPVEDAIDIGEFKASPTTGHKVSSARSPPALSGFEQHAYSAALGGAAAVIGVLYKEVLDRIVELLWNKIPDHHGE